jgi:hypothetical protein
MSRVDGRPNVVNRTIEKCEVETLLPGGKFKLKKTTNSRDIQKAKLDTSND